MVASNPPAEVDGRPRILVVDDEPAVTMMIGQLLERSLPVRVLQVNSGQDALDLLRHERFDLIVTDQIMPGLKGTEFLEEAKRLAPETPRTMLTSESDLDLAVHALNDLRIAAFYPKPIDSDDFVRSIKGILARKRADETKQAGFEQAAKVFRGEGAAMEERSRPFVGSLHSEEE
jgi:DNA-binding NtrC family response regulator